MAQTSLQLPTIHGLPVGDVKSYLFYDDSMGPLIAPSGCPFLDIGEIVESIDMEAGFTDLDNVQVIVREDYTQLEYPNIPIYSSVGIPVYDSGSVQEFGNGTNLSPITGFENPADTFFNGFPGNHTASRTTLDSKTGSACCRITASGAGSAWSNCIYYYSISIDVTKTHKFMFSAKSISGNTDLYVYGIFTGAGAHFVLTSDWQTFVINGSHLPGDVSAPMFFLGGAGTCDIDDINFQEASTHDVSAITASMYVMSKRYSGGGNFVNTWAKVTSASSGVIHIDAWSNGTPTNGQGFQIYATRPGQPSGFWYNLIQNNPDLPVEIMFTVMEGTDETFLFRGKLYRQNIKWNEVYLDKLSGTPTRWERGVKFQLVSSLQVLEEVTIDALLTECKLHAVTGGSTGYDFVKMQDVVASMIKLAFAIAFDSSTCVNNSYDIQPVLEIVDPPTLAWTDCGIAVRSTGGADVGFFDKTSTNVAGWYNKYATAYDLLKSFCFQFAVVPRYQFGTLDGLIDPTPSNNTHRLIFNSRGQSGAMVTMSNSVPASVLVSDTPRRASSYRITDSRNGDLTYYILNGVLVKGEAPPAQFDIDGTVDFQVHYTLDEWQWSLAASATSYGHLVTMIQWKNYQDPLVGYYENDVTNDNCLAKALVQYLNKRFGPGRTQYTRAYNSIQANNGSYTSQRYNRTLMRTQINDGVASRTYYATEVRKNVLTGKSQIIWVQE